MTSLMSTDSWMPAQESNNRGLRPPSLRRSKMENYYVVYVNDVPMTEPVSHAEAYDYAHDHADDGYIWIRQVDIPQPE